MLVLTLVRIIFLAAGILSVVLSFTAAHRFPRLGRLPYYILGVTALLSLGFMAFLWVNHVGFPANLDLMEGTILQHVQQIVAGQPIYPEPTPAYVPLAYNPLYYVLAVPFTWVFGVNLFTLRLVAILATLGSTLLIYDVIRRHTGSAYWGLMGAGLFAAAYYIMDTYLDNAHSDSWFVFSALLGTYIIDRSKTRAGNLLGVIVLIISFWFKQHGAIFAIGGVLYLTWREGLLKSIPYWLVAGILGPGAYWFAGPVLFGPRFLFFTWEVPRAWSQVDRGTFVRYVDFIRRSYLLLAISSGSLTIWKFIRDRAHMNIWHVQLIFAALTGFMGSLDAGSANNVYIPMGTWFILVGTLGLYEFAQRSHWAQRYSLHLVVLFASFTIFLYSPQSVIVSPQADQAYDDLIGMLNNVDGPVYAPTLGQLQSGYQFYPAAHWVALEDMIRGPGRDTTNHPNTRRLLEPLINPGQGETPYILYNVPNGGEGFLGFLEDYYVLDTDFGERFEPLRVLPKRFDHLYPRYLYRYDPAKAAAGQTNDGG